MTIEIKVPELPESISEAQILTWHKKAGELVRQDDMLVDLETDKVVLEVPAPASGKLLEIKEAEGDMVSADSLLALLEEQEVNNEQPAPSEKQKTESLPLPSSVQTADAIKTHAESNELPAMGPAVRRLVEEYGLNPATIPVSGKNGRLTKDDVQSYYEELKKRQEDEAVEQARFESQSELKRMIAEEAQTQASMLSPDFVSGHREQKRVPMTRLRAKIAERLMTVAQTTAMLTTFNEVDLSAVIALRKQYQDKFVQTFDVKLGFMSFFVKAVCESLKRFPDVNASIDGDDIVYHGFCDIGVAVSTDRGLVVPIIRNAEHLSLSEIEMAILDYSKKARGNELTIEDISGGTFTITNGGVFGSLMSTPILNPPQAAILGMHAIQERPIAIEGEVVIRPMMYLALSYDHRLIDGKSAVQFLRTIKELLQDPARILLDV